MEDNGPGFQLNGVAEQANHQSVGLKIIYHYFDLWNKDKELKASFQIYNKEKHQLGKGTLVKIKIPV